MLERPQCRCWNHCFWQWVPDLWGGNRKISAANGGKFEISYVQAIGAGRAECSSTTYVSNMSEWSQVSRRGIMKNFVAQYSNLLLYALRDPQPVKADEYVADVIGAFQYED